MSETNEKTVEAPADNGNTTDTQPAQRIRRPVSKKPLTILNVAAKKYGWTMEDQLLILSGFAAEQLTLAGKPTDAEMFYQAIVDHANKMGWSLRSQVQQICGSVEDAGTVDLLANWLDEAGVAWKEALASPAEQAPEVVVPRQESTPDDTHFYERPDVLARAVMLLELPGSSPDKEVGETLMQWVFPMSDNHRIFVEVVNGDPTYVDAYLLHGDEVVEAAPTYTCIDREYEFKHDGKTYRATIHKA